MSICSTHSSGDAPERDGLGERVEVGDHQVERLDAELGQLRHMRGQPPVREDARVHPRVQRLDPAVEALGEAGELLHPGDREAEALDERRGAARWRPARPRRRAGLGPAPRARSCRRPRPAPGGAGSRPQRRSHSWPNRTFLSLMVKPSRAIRPTVSTSIARSATLIRSWSDSTVSSSSTGTAVWATIGPGVDAGVDQEERRAGDLDAVGERVRGTVHAGEGRGQGGMGVDDAAAERARKSSPTSFMKPAEHHQVGLDGRPRPRCMARVPAPRGLGVVRDPAHERRDPGPLGPGQALDAVAGRRRRRPPRRRTPGPRRRRAAPAGWCRTRTPGRPGARAWGWARAQCIDRVSAGPRSARHPLDGPGSGGEHGGRRRCHQVITSPPTSPPMPKAGTACTSTSATAGPTSRIRPGPAAPPGQPPRAA